MAARRSGERGYAAVDALMALLILSMALIMSFQALQQAGKVSVAAWEVRRADTLLSYLIQTTPPSFEVKTGQDQGFDWRVETDATGAARPIEICRRSVTLHGLASGRTFAAATLQVCPVPI